jgi:hypothetical protein
MLVSNENVKKFLHDVIQQTNFPGHLSEFVSAVKREVATAQVEPPIDAGGQVDGTASARRDSHQAG